MSEPSVSIRRKPRKIRYTDHEWERIIAQARACSLPPATFVRQTSLGATPQATPNQSQNQLILELGRIAKELQRLSGEAADPAQLQFVLDETLAAIPRISS